MDLTLIATGARLRLTGSFAASVTPPHAGGGTLDSAEAVGIAEETALHVWLEGETAVSLRHDDPLVTADLRSERGGRIVTGRLVFGSHVGRTRLDIVGADGVLAGLELDVVPQKATPGQVALMRREVELAWAGVSFAAVRPATATVGTNLAAARVEPAWVAVLDAALPAVESALDGVTRRPLREVTREQTLRPTASLSRLRAPEVARLARRSGTDPERWPPRILAMSPRQTTDTPALRWVARRLSVAAVRAFRLAAAESRRTPTARRRVLTDRLRAHVDTLRSLCRSDALPRPNASVALPAVAPLALRRRPEHRRLYDAVRLLEAGLDLADGDLHPALRDLATLYETWCVLTVTRAAARAISAAVPQVVLSRAGTDVALARGARVEMQADGVTLQVEVQPRFGGAPALLVQRPDLVLTVVGPGGTHRVVLDAKYRRDDSRGALRRFEGPAPPADALGALHRYRDAILGPDGEPHWIDAAVALYPHAGDVPSLRRSIDGLGVGAIPLLPGSTATLEGWLYDLVSSVR